MPCWVDVTIKAVYCLGKYIFVSIKLWNVRTIPVNVGPTSYDFSPKDLHVIDCVCVLINGMLEAGYSNSGIGNDLESFFFHERVVQDLTEQILRTILSWYCRFTQVSISIGARQLSLRINGITKVLSLCGLVLQTICKVGRELKFIIGSNVSEIGVFNCTSC